MNEGLILKRIAELEENFEKRLNEISDENGKNLLHIINQLDEIHEVMYRKPRGRKGVKKVFLKRFGEDSVVKLKNENITVETEYPTFSIDVLNKELKVTGYACKLENMELLRGYVRMQFSLHRRG